MAVGGRNMIGGIGSCETITLCALYSGFCQPLKKSESHGSPAPLPNGANFSRIMGSCTYYR